MFKSFNEIVGHDNLKGILENLANNPRSVIFFGPSGVGKTECARLVGSIGKMNTQYMNATVASVTDIKKLVKPTLLILDEIQYFNKKQQQVLLSAMDEGQIILIGITTEDPWHTLNKAILSRVNVIQFNALTQKDIEQHLGNLVKSSSLNISPEVLHHIAVISDGDMRMALNTYDFIKENNLDTIQKCKDFLPSLENRGFEDSEEDYWSLLSALQKSVRGGDTDAAVFYLTALLKKGGLESACRRLLVMSQEDIGLAGPSIPMYVYQAVESAKLLGMPEGRYALINAVILMAQGPKSDLAGRVYQAAATDIDNGLGRVVPKHLRRDGAAGYKNPHNYPNHWVAQQYLPNDLYKKKRKYVD